MSHKEQRIVHQLLPSVVNRLKRDGFKNCHKLKHKVNSIKFPSSGHSSQTFQAHFQQSSRNCPVTSFSYNVKSVSLFRHSPVRLWLWLSYEGWASHKKGCHSDGRRLWLCENTKVDNGNDFFCPTPFYLLQFCVGTEKCRAINSPNCAASDVWPKRICWPSL